MGPYLDNCPKARGQPTLRYTSQEGWCPWRGINGEEKNPPCARQCEFLTNIQNQVSVYRRSNVSCARECEFLTNIQNQVSDNLRSNVVAHLIYNILVKLLSQM